MEIHGTIEGRCTKDIEYLVWKPIREAAHLRQNVGIFTSSSNQQGMSHSLTLSQLFIAQHVVKAALGEHAK